MKGITEERLLEICALDQVHWATVDYMVSQCTEINPWQPIESAPKDRRILLFFPKYGAYDGGYLMKRRDGIEVFAASASLKVPLGIAANHWQELPEDPK